ncbi:hypothetical protein NBE98_04270 [Clostridium swellfunianum]|nr:hypothetical protein [Clostridium swellfunianum]
MIAIKKPASPYLFLLRYHLSADLITERPPYSKIVNNSFAEKTIKDVK